MERIKRLRMIAKILLLERKISMLLGTDPDLFVIYRGYREV